ncbi:hypothetical protein SALWKB29_0664 [Snodgrassella communis]|uniref:Uncharacterized protein n=1 Tax=Snodgrassella communis TaxID=2946699 RepID=A0A836MSS3_9NEIS|nr:hypothetical protein SALWKB29_0664 [Snodgrassella communis]
MLTRWRGCVQWRQSRGHNLILSLFVLIQPILPYILIQLGSTTD